MKLLGSLVVSTLVLASCVQLDQFGCPVPERAKLRKQALHQARYDRARNRQLLAQQEVVAEKVYERDGLKELEFIQEWDCPKPGTRHDRLIQAKRRRIEMKYEEALKKREKNTEETEQSPRPPGSNY